MGKKDKKAPKGDPKPVKIACHDLTVKVQYEDGTPVPDCTAEVKIGTRVILDNWALGADGEDTRSVRATKLASPVTVVGVDSVGRKFVSYVLFKGGFSRDATAVFILLSCAPAEGGE